jgi:hypothetical protein
MVPDLLPSGWLRFVAWTVAGAAARSTARVTRSGAMAAIAEAAIDNERVPVRGGLERLGQRRLAAHHPYAPLVLPVHFAARVRLGASCIGLAATFGVRSFGTFREDGVYNFRMAFALGVAEDLPHGKAGVALGVWSR